MLAGTILASAAVPACAAAQHSLHRSTHPGHRNAATAPGMPAAMAPTKAVQKHHIAAPSGSESVLVERSRRARNGGGGMMRVETASYAVQSVGREYIAMRSPTSTGLDLVSYLPSVSIAMPDNSGVRGGAVFMRGFTDADMALLLDGAPSSLAAYLQQNVLPEDIESVVITPSSSPVDAPAPNASAGTLDERTITPSHERGGTFDFSFGTYGLSRQFIRLQSGDIGNSGIRSYIAFGNIRSSQWNGAGVNQLRHIDVGAQKDFKNGSTAKLFVSWNNANFPIDNYPTESQFFTYKHTGTGFDRSTTWDPNAANAGNYWKSNIDSWNQFYVAAPAHIIATKRLSFDLNPYMTTGFGYDGLGGGTAGQNASCPCQTASGAPVAPGTQLSNYWAQQWSPNVGVIAKASYEIDLHNTVSAGYWYSSNTSTYYLPYAITKSNGQNPSPSTAARRLYDANGQWVANKFNSGNEINSFFVEAKQNYLNKRLQFDEGFKFVMSNYWSKETGLTHGRLGANSTAPLPHFSASYRIDPNSQVYVNAEGDFRQPSPSQLGAGLAIPKNQYSITEQIGYRFQDTAVIVDASAFNTSVTNRLLNTYLGGGAYGTINAGNQTTRGLDLMVSGRSWHHFSPYASIEYLSGHFDSNIPYGASYLPTKGKQSILTPRFLANAGLTYESNGFFGNASVHYTGPQSVTLVGDQRMPGFVTNQVALGYHFKPFYYLKTPTIRMNFANITGSVIRVGANGIATNRNAVTLINGTAGPAANAGALFYVQPNFSMVGTFSTDF